jgi:puromycin-sensitive aminopeptidase
MAFAVDSLASTRAVEFPVFAPADCDGMFDVLTYQKGGALLRMLEQYLGVEGFRAGVNHYLRTHAHANTETGDLWDAIEAMNPGTPVRRMMDSWIWQPGYPLMLARLDGADLVLSQQRFAFGPTDDPTLWVVPVHVRNGGSEQRVLIDGDTVRVHLDAPDDAVIVNAGGHGFMRVGYDATLRGRLDGAALAELSTIERYNLVDDAWNECVAGRLDAAGLLALLEGFSSERDLAVWQAVAMALRGLGRLVDGDAHAAFRARVHALASPALDALGWQPAAGEDDLTGKLRGLLVGLVAVLGDDADAQARCRTIFDAPDGVHPELVAAATTVVASIGGDDEYERLLHGFRHGTTPQEQLRHLYALADLPDAALVQRVCELALSDEVKTMNAPFLLQRCIANRHHGVQAWQYVRQHWAEINDRFPASLIVRVADPAKLLNTPEVVADVQAFFTEHPIAQSAKTLDQVLERQRVNAALRTRDEAPLTAALLG